MRHRTVMKGDGAARGAAAMLRGQAPRTDTDAAGLVAQRRRSHKAVSATRRWPARDAAQRTRHAADEAVVTSSLRTGYRRLSGLREGGDPAVIVWCTARSLGPSEVGGTPRARKRT
jgi:hypothetical protein